MCSGPANLINSYKCWRNNQQDPSQVSITFSSQILDYCRDNNVDVFMTSTHANGEVCQDDNVIIEHRKRPIVPLVSDSFSYQIGSLLHTLAMLRKAIRFRADVALVDSGSTHYFMLFLFRVFGIKVITIMHNTLWPKGFRPTGRLSRIRSWCDRAFLIHGANAILSVSKECENQILELCGNKPDFVEKLFSFRAQFHKEYFEGISTPEYEQQPFKIMFIGRIEKYKGVFDLLDIAERLERKHSKRFQWVICGTGPELEGLRAVSTEKGLSDIVDILGWVSLEQLQTIYKGSHMSIVPTTSGFSEGLAMTAVESVLAGRPVITSSVVPALSEMRPACYEAVTDDIDSYVSGVEKIALSKPLYEKMRLSCMDEALQFLDRDQGLTVVLKKALNTV